MVVVDLALTHLSHGQSLADIHVHAAVVLPKDTASLQKTLRNPERIYNHSFIVILTETIADKR